MHVLNNPDSSEDLFDIEMMDYIKDPSGKSIARSTNHPNKSRKTTERVTNDPKKPVTQMRQLIRDYKSVFTRAYRMDVENFWRLHRLIKDQLTQMFFNRTRDTSSGYFIPTAIRLSISLRFLQVGP